VASRDIFSALAVPNFRWLWIGSLGSSFAMNMQIIARGWLVYALTSSAIDLAWVTLSFMLPSVIFSLYGGVLADRLPKRRGHCMGADAQLRSDPGDGDDHIQR
jgi:MFS family permease